MRRGLLTLSSLIVVTALPACKSIMDPTFMPSGYTYHHNTYKSPPGDNPWPIGYEYNKLKNQEMLAIWEATSNEMLSELEVASQISPEAVYVAPPELDNAFTHSFDHTFRDALRKRGYTLVNAPGPDILTLTLGSYDPEFKDAMRGFVYNDVKDEEEPPVQISKQIVLTVKAMRGNANLGTLEGEYTMPLYGYQDRQMYQIITQHFAEVWR